jgi:hypothetical protein
MVGDETEVEWWAVAGVSHVAWLVLCCVVLLLSWVVLCLDRSCSLQTSGEGTAGRKKRRNQDQRGSDGPSSFVVCPTDTCF